MGKERYIALGLLNLVLRNGRPAGIQRSGLPANVTAFTPTVVEERTGVKTQTLKRLAQHFLGARRPLVLAEGMGFQDPAALETAVAANILCTISPGSRDLFDFSNPMSLGKIAPASEIMTLTRRMAGGNVGALVLYRANAVYGLPVSWGFEKALKTIPLVISFSSFPDETTGLASLIMSASTFLESWGDYSPSANVTGLLQPAMGPLFKTRQLGDIILATGKGVAGQAKFPEKDFYEVLRNTWNRNGKRQIVSASSDAD